MGFPSVLELRIISEKARERKVRAATQHQLDSLGEIFKEQATEGETHVAVNAKQVNEHTRKKLLADGLHISNSSEMPGNLVISWAEIPHF